MIQKYLIVRDQENSVLTIEEYAVVDALAKNVDIQNLNEDPFSFICKSEYDCKIIEAALTKGKHAVISSIRTNNMYPIGNYADAIAESITNLFESEGNETVEVMFNDIELISEKEPE
jgi:hypothetical protein